MNYKFSVIYTLGAAQDCSLIFSGKEGNIWLFITPVPKVLIHYTTLSNSLA